MPDSQMGAVRIKTASGKVRSIKGTAFPAMGTSYAKAKAMTPREQQQLLNDFDRLNAKGELTGFGFKKRPMPS